MPRQPRIYPFFRVTPPGITARLTRPVAWRPMTDDEWERVMHFMVYVHPAAGRQTIMGARRSLDACFHAACMDGPWKDLPAHYGKPDTISRLFRRWTHAGLWKMMLTFVARDEPGLEAIQYFVCRAYRRAHRIQGLRGITHARRLGLDSALRAPSWCLPDTDLSKYMDQVLQPRLRHWLMRQREGIIRANIAVLKRLHSLCAGYRSIRRWMAPENIVYGFETLYRDAAMDGSSRKWT